MFTTSTNFWRHKSKKPEIKEKKLAQHYNFHKNAGENGKDITCALQVQTSEDIKVRYPKTKKMNYHITLVSISTQAKNT